MDRLFEAVDVIDTVGDPGATDITSIEFDDTAVTPGALFFCLPGHHRDGHDFAPSAVDRGAVGLLVERALPVPVVQQVVEAGTARHAMALVARAFYGDPAGALTTVGVTGTNGKTSVTRFVAGVLDAAGRRCDVIGTLDGPRTTPEAPVLHGLLAADRDDGFSAVALEVSSHALAESRVDGIVFDVAAFTNLSHDHLDYHHTMEEYFEAKASLFAPERARVGVVNADDEWGRRIIERGAVELRPYSMSEVGEVSTDATGTSFTWRGRHMRLGLAGRFHVANALCAAAVAEVLEVPLDAVEEAFASMAPVPGRFQVVPEAAPFTVVVDYAHTPDALAEALRSSRAASASGRVLVVFGCGGDRDRAKRPAMGTVAAAGAEVVVVTSDNSRGEDPAAIIDEVVGGVGPGVELLVEPDRRSAIAAAVEQAEPGDVVLVAGKGHERTISAGGTDRPFDDVEEAAGAVRARRDKAVRR